MSTFALYSSQWTRFWNNFYLCFQILNFTKCIAFTRVTYIYLWFTVRFFFSFPFFFSNRRCGFIKRRKCWIRNHSLRLFAHEMFVNFTGIIIASYHGFKSADGCKNVTDLTAIFSQRWTMNRYTKAWFI